MTSVSGAHPHDEALATPPAHPEAPAKGPPSRPPLVPDAPLVVIERSAPWTSLDLRGLWSHRELFFFLVWRDITVRYRQTVLGAGWAVLQPLATMLVFAYVFGRLVKMPSDGLPYPVFAYTGLLIWTFFSNAVALASNSIVGDAGLIAKIYFPRLIIPAATVAGSLIDFAIASVLLVPMMAYYGLDLGWSALLVPVFMLLAMLLALAVGMLVSALTVRYRDVRYALPFVVQLWFFVTPIIYPASLVPAAHRWVLDLNPLTGIVEGYRKLLYGQPVAWASIAWSAAIVTALLFCAAHVFRRAEKSFAEFL